MGIRTLIPCVSLETRGRTPDPKANATLPAHKEW